MGATLPELSFESFAHRLDRLIERLVGSSTGRTNPPSKEMHTALFAHYGALRQWNRRLSLIGPGTVDEVLERHYAESLVGAPLVPPHATVVDIGSGGGFPGFVLAAARPDIQVLLVESRARKWSFLCSAIRRAHHALTALDVGPFALSCRALNARIERPLPAGLPDRIDLVTSRAVHLTDDLIGAFREHPSPVEFLLWRGSDGGDLPAGLEVVQRISTPGSHSRSIVLATGPRDST